MGDSSREITVLDEKLIELLKEMAASEPAGQIEMPRGHDPELK